MATITGTNGFDGLRGTPLDDVMLGLAGNDVLLTSAGDDVFDGGDGIDFAAFDEAPGPVRIDLEINGRQNTGDGFDTFISVEQLNGGRFSDILRGNAADNSINGLAGDDLLEGRGGADVLLGGLGADTLIGGEGNDYLSGDSGIGQLLGGAGDDFLAVSLGGGPNPGGEILLDGGDGVDLLEVTGAAGLTIDLRITGKQQIAPGVWATVRNIENLNGYYQSDRLTGDAGNNRFDASLGNDEIDGQGGFDTAVYNIYSFEASVAKTATGFTVTDLAPYVDRATLGTDRLTNVERVQFRDRTLNLPITPSTPAEVGAAAANLLRSSGDAFAAKVASGQLTAAQAMGEIMGLASGATSVATLTYQFFTGKIPSAAGMDYLVSATGPNPNNLNSPYYQGFSYENRFINFAVNLGKNGEGALNFLTFYGGPVTLFEATRRAYGVIFGDGGTDEKIAALLGGGRAAYFASYGQDGPEGIGTKAAMVGWLLAEAEKSHIGELAKRNGVFLADLADGADIGVSLSATYDPNWYGLA